MTVQKLGSAWGNPDHQKELMRDSLAGMTKEAIIIKAKGFLRGKVKERKPKAVAVKFTFSTFESFIAALQAAVADALKWQKNGTTAAEYALILGRRGGREK